MQNTAPKSTAAFTGGHSKNIGDTAREDGEFTTLLAAVEVAALVETLKGAGPFTAQTDSAFDVLPEGTGKEVRTSVLKYHVVPGEVMTTRISASSWEPRQSSATRSTSI
ncbi:fasciclin domain-containing protein [uncultured Sulfitobacter sp.]|uniref:fasciclin domain-containing protein n=1 Tax=uncultured Sulfitobacter sp. TaxID=191468 RepID=UPI002635C49E|nr:fasciclin domain-containing protein [uncultured Sulfitobacter sp.]